MKQDKNWQIATLVESKVIAINVKSLIFKPARGQAHQSGQHYDLRLMAPNGYQAERSYSVASPPENPGLIEFGVQLLANGEVSPYLWELKPGKQIEIRGPIGGHFVWDYLMSGPLVLIGGGSGMVPLIAMARHWQVNWNKETTPGQVIFLASCRTLEHVLYREELEQLEKTGNNFRFVKVLTNTEKRVDEEKLRAVLGEIASQMPMCYVCGPTGFVEAIANALVKLKINPHLIKTECFS